jgi:hypothetical protein
MLLYIFFGGFIIPIDLLRMPLNTTDDKVIEYIFTGISNLIPNS